MAWIDCWLRALVVEKLQIIAERDHLITRHERTLCEREARISVLTAEIARSAPGRFQCTP